MPMRHFYVNKTLRTGEEPTVHGSRTTMLNYSMTRGFLKTFTRYNC